MTEESGFPPAGIRIGWLGRTVWVIAIAAMWTVLARAEPDRPRGYTAQAQPPLTRGINLTNWFRFPGSADPVALAELGKYENERKRAARRRPPPDPYALAAEYLQKAGYDKAALDAVAPLLEAADRNYLIEKQFKTPLNAPQWSPVATQ